MVNDYAPHSELRKEVPSKTATMPLCIQEIFRMPVFVLPPRVATSLLFFLINSLLFFAINRQPFPLQAKKKLTL